MLLDVVFNVPTHFCMDVCVCVGMKRITHGSACLFHVSLQSIVSRLLWVPLPAVIERSKKKKKKIRNYIKETAMLLLEYEALATMLLYIFVFIGCVLFSKNKKCNMNE